MTTHRRHLASALRHGLLALGAPLLAACAADATSPLADEPIAAPESGPTRVSRARLDGRTLTLDLTSALAADPSSLRVRTLRRADDGAMTWVDLASGAAIDASGRRLVVTLRDLLSEEATLTVTAARADASEIDLAEIAVRAYATANAASGTDAHALGFGGSVGPVRLPPIYIPPPASTFRVATSEPADGAIDVARDLVQVKVTFTGGTIDCAATQALTSPIRVVSQDTQRAVLQDMYQVAGAEQGTAPLHRGRLACDAFANTLTLFLPGRNAGGVGLLYGGATFLVDVTAQATGSGGILQKRLQFSTATPGLTLEMMRVANNLKWEPDDPTLACTFWQWTGSGTNCSQWKTIYNDPDVYVTFGAAGAGTSNAGRVPDQQQDYESMAKGTSVTLPTPTVMFQTGQPIGESMTLGFVSYDADSDGWFVTAVNWIAAESAKVAQYFPVAAPYAGLARILSDALPKASDDLVGTNEIELTRDGSRWGTAYRNYAGADWIEATAQKVALTRPNHDGELDVFVRTTEFPGAWVPPMPLQ